MAAPSGSKASPGSGRPPRSCSPPTGSYRAPPTPMEVKRMPDDASPVVATGSSIKVGRVVSVSGAPIIALIRDPRSCGGPDREQMVQVGSLVQTYTADAVVFGMVRGFSITIPPQHPREPELKIAIER